MARILVADDEPTIREVLTDFLELEGYEVVAVSDGEQALTRLERERWDALLIDLKMPGMSGLDVLHALRDDAPLVLMMTGFGTVETAIGAMKAGAYDYILKPFKVQEVIKLLERGLAQRRLERENIQLKEALRLYEHSEAMSGTLELGRVYALLVAVAREEVEADAVVVWRKGAGGLEVAKTWSRSDLDEDHRRSLGCIDAERVLEQGGGVWRGADAASLAPRAGWSAHMAPAILTLPMRSKGEIVGAFSALSFGDGRVFTEGKRKMLAVLCGRASAAVESAGLYGELKDTFKQTIQALANLLEDKDPYTRGHSDRVSEYASMIAKGLGLSAREVEDIEDCALMHDIGKLGIRYEDLNKVEPLTEAEYEMFKSHTTRGKWILEPIAFLHHLIPGVYHHHERWDGRGYPQGLEGEEIPLVARILAIADTYDAMTSHRAYRRALPHDVAIREIQAFAGAQFDPALVEVFVREITKSRGAGSSKAQRWGALEGDLPAKRRQVVEG
jgi:response regulator RpfG family c-di-GMP phosphodiesterase